MPRKINLKIAKPKRKKLVTPPNSASPVSAQSIATTDNKMPTPIIYPAQQTPVDITTSQTATRWLIMASIIIMIGLVGLVTWWSTKNHESGIANQELTTTLTNSANNNTNSTPQLTSIAPLTGTLVSAEDNQRRAWATVVENFPSARPQFGLSSADLVFEAPTEGGVTRFLAIWQSTLPQRVGPIRSARPYFNDWARTFNAFYSHSGGTSEALQQLKKGYGDLQDVNEFFNEQGYERDSTKLPPHNLFTGAERFWNYVTSRGWTTIQPTPSLTFSNGVSLSPATSITVPYTPPEYRVTWNFQPATSTYQRSIQNIIQTDANTNTPLEYQNVIILLTDTTPILNDPLLRINIRTTGSGKALLFSRGLQYSGRWVKLHLDSPLSFITDDNKPMSLTAGHTWISVLGAEHENELLINGKPLK